MPDNRPATAFYRERRHSDAPRGTMPTSCCDGSGTILSGLMRCTFHYRRRGYTFSSSFGAYGVPCSSVQPYLRGDWVRSLFTPFDARAHFILYPCRSPHGGRLTNPMTWLHAHGPCACSRQGPSISAQGVLKWEGQRSRRSATRATAAPRPERTNKTFDFVAWKGGVACSEAVQTMGAWLARCGRVPVQRVARSHATVSVSPIREELGK